MKYKLNENNNSKKLIIGVSIIFCTVILIIGVTTAFFTQSGSGTTGNIVTTDIRDTLEYTDDTTYMRQGLIPAKEEIAKQAYNITGDNKCLDSLGYSACSVYQFTIKNNANVSQELIIDMIPTVNTFTNLYFILYEIDSEGNSSEIISSQKIEKITDINNMTTYNLKSELTLNPSVAKTYQVVFFINDTGADQTLEDAGKNFGATIKITSVATGTYIVETFGESCWTTELLSDGTYKLTEFHGINNDSTDTDNYGKINESCTGYVEQDNNTGFYSVNIPSTVGGQQISTLGNSLFNAAAKDSDGNILGTNNFHNIELITIRDGITVIEDGDLSTYSGTFMGIGVNLSTQRPYADRSLEVILPETLEIIGAEAFTGSALSKLIIPSSVTIIGSRSFNATSNLKSITFSESNGEDINLLSIESGAFSQSGLTNLTIPSRVNIIGNAAFLDNLDLTALTFSGAVDGTSKLTTIGKQVFEGANIYSDIDNPLLIPSSVETMGTDAFRENYNLTTLEFVGASDNTSSLKTIDTAAFGYCNITTDDDNPLVIPASVENLSGFTDNKNLTNVIIMGAEDGTSKLQTISGFGWTGITSITIPASVENLSGFGYNKNLTSVTIMGAEDGTSKLTTIGGQAFASTAISSIMIPVGVTTIGELAFRSTGLGSITIPSSVTTIGKEAFNSNSNLTTVTFSGAEDGTSKLQEIGERAFNGCNLTYPDENNYLLLPSTITTMGDYAFSNNSNLKYIKFTGNTSGFGTSWNGSATIIT